MDGLDDEWDESIVDELIRVHDELFRAHDEAVAPLNPNPTPAPTPAPFDLLSTAAVSYLPAAALYPSSAALPLFHIAAAPHASASAIRFSSPRELTQRPSPAAVAASGSEILALVPAVGCGFAPPRELSQRPAAEESDCEIIGVAGPAGGDRFRGGAVRREREAREVERLKKELNRVSKQMNDLKNECSELKKDRTKKDIEIKAKEADIQNLKKANLGCASKDICSMGMDIDRSFHTPANGALHAGGSFWTSTRRAEKSNGKNKELSRDGLCLNERNQTDASEVLELKHRTMIDNSTSTSGGVSLEESAHLESKSNKCKEIKTIGVQTDLPWNSQHLECKKVLLERISSNLCAIWGMPTNSLLGRNLISKILVSCSEEILQLLQSMTFPDETSSEASSPVNNAISEVYAIIIKMNSDTISIHTLLEALLNLCAVGNAVVAGRALRMLHSILQHLLNYVTKSSQSVTSGTMFLLSHMLTIAWTWGETTTKVVLLC